MNEIKYTIKILDQIICKFWFVIFLLLDPGFRNGYSDFKFLAEILMFIVVLILWIAKESPGGKEDYQRLTRILIFFIFLDFFIKHTDWYYFQDVWGGTIEMIKEWRHSC